MIIRKKQHLDVTEDKLWAAASDLKSLSDCIPGVISFDQKDERVYKAKVRPMFSFLRGTVDLNFEVINLKKGHGEVKITGGFIGSSFEVLVNTFYKKKGKGVELDIKIDSKFGGLLKPVPESILKGAAEHIAGKMIECIEGKLK